MVQKKYRNASMLYKNLAVFCIAVMTLPHIMLYGCMASSYSGNKSTILDELKVKITHPEGNSLITPSYVDVKGTIEGKMPDKEHLWLLLNLLPGNLWYSSGGTNGGLIKPENGFWEIKDVLIQGDCGRQQYNIAVFLVNKTDESSLNNSSSKKEKDRRAGAQTLDALFGERKDLKANKIFTLPCGQ